MFGNKLMTALVTLKTMADQQSASGSSLKVVLLVVQCMKQYTEQSWLLYPKSTSTMEAGTTQSPKPFLAR